MGDNENNVTEDLFGDPNFHAAYTQLTKERLEQAMGSVQKDVPLTSSTNHRHSKLQKVRHLLAKPIVGLSLVSLVCCFFNIPVTFIIAPITLLSGLGFIIIVFQEVTLGAGKEVQTQFKKGDAFHREFKFVPSFGNLYLLLRALAIGFASVILGFAHCYQALNTHFTDSFSVNIQGISAIYFSIVTFATVGFGDIYPKSDWAKLLVTCEILSSLFLITIILTTTISWVSANQQRVQEQYLAKQKLQMQQTEELLKTAKIGHYSDDTLKEEAKERAAQSKASE